MKCCRLSQQAAVLLALLSVAIASSSQEAVHSGGGGGLRVNPSPSKVERQLEDGDEGGGDDNDANNNNQDNANNDDNAADDDAEERYYQDDAIQGYNDYYDDEGGWSYTSQASMTDDYTTASSNRTRYEAIKSTVQNYASNAETTAWEFYDSPPSQWTTHQWDLAFGLLFVFLGSCCGVLACCTYHCFNNDDGNVDAAEMMEPLSPKTRRGGQLYGNVDDVELLSPKTRRGGKLSSVRSAARSAGRSAARSAGRQYRKSRDSSKSSHRNRFNNDHYKEYQETREEEDQFVIRQKAYEEEEEDGITVDTEDADQSCYEPPEAVASPSSLADYTLVQREKEARLLEAWKEDQLQKHGYPAAAADDVEASQQHDIDAVYTNEDWEEGVNDDTTPSQPTTVTKNSASEELDAALHHKTLENNLEESEDKLLEARARQHNLVGYYL